MAYRDDPDLEFLGLCESKELDDLVNILIHDNDGDLRLTEELTMTDEYKKYHPDHSRYWQNIAAELQCYGANTFTTILRGGKGVLYKEILIDVCKKLKVNFNSNSSVEIIEYNLLTKLITDSLANMDDNVIRKLATEMKVKNYNLLTPQLLTSGFIAAFKAGGFTSYKLTVIVVNHIMKILVGRGLSLAANASLMRTMAVLSGPIGWTATGVWTLIDIGSAAYRVTIPAIIQVAFLRYQMKSKSTFALEFE